MSRSERSVREQLGDLAGDVTDTIGRPIKGASLFYALYYLVEIEGYEPAVFDFRKLVDEYHRGFYWYGIFSILSEFSHVTGRYFFDGEEVFKYLQRRSAGNVELEPADLRPHAESLVDPATLDGTGFDAKLIETILADLFQAGRSLAEANVREPGSSRNVLELLTEAQGVYPPLPDDPEPLIVAIGQMFHNSETARRYIAEHPTPPGFTDEEIEEMDFNERVTVFRASGWISQEWNGPGWAGVTDHLLRRDELSQTAWVDQSWSIEHNNNRWVDKVEIQDRERAVVSEVVRPNPAVDRPADVIVLGALEDLLDAAQEGNMDLIFDTAVEYTRDLDVNLRRARTVVGV